MRIVGTTPKGNPKAECPWCKRIMLAANVRRHIETKCPKWPQLRLFEEKKQ
jgi:phage FluMu protein Com